MTGRSKGFGFCRFGDESERDRAIVEMAGHYINNRPIRVSTATARKAPSVPYPPNPADSESPFQLSLKLPGRTVHRFIEECVAMLKLLSARRRQTPQVKSKE